MNFNHAISEYRRYLWQKNYSKNTLINYCKVIEQILKNKNLDKLKKRDLENIQIELNKKYETNGNRLRFSAINLFCEKILKRKDLKIKIPKSERKNKDVLTNAQVERILETAKNKNLTAYAVLQTIYDCGLRKMEACKLDLSDVDYTKMEITIRDAKTGDGVVTMTTRTAQAIKDYVLYQRKPKDEKEKALFLNDFGKRIGDHYVRNHLKEYAVVSGITKNVYPHMLRSSCITHLLNCGINPITVQEHARHADFRTTMIYNRPTQQQMKTDIERVFVRKLELNDEDRARVIFDKYLKGEMTSSELHDYLDVIRPKELKHDLECTGYQ